MAEVAFLDLETTSRFPWEARIVEIAVIIWDPEVDSKPQEWETLVNPMVHIPEESTKVHGISGSDLQLAPAFPEIAEEFARLLDRRVVVGHNIRAFDIRIANKEFQKANIDFQIERYFDTYESLDRRALDRISSELGFDTASLHTAASDCRVTLELVRKHGIDPGEHAAGALHRAPRFNHRTARTFSRYQAGLTDFPKSELSLSMLNELEHIDAPTRYLHLFDEVLRDLKMSDSDWEKLDAFAEANGLYRSARDELHREYLSQLEASALRDHVVSEEEIQTISTVAEQLEIPLSIQLSQTENKAELSIGATVVSSGSATIGGVSWGKEELKGVIEHHGFNWHKSVTKKTTLLICQELHATTQNVMKAKKYGIPRMTIEDFLQRYPFKPDTF